MKCGNIFKQTKTNSFLEFKTVAVIISGDYYLILFHDDVDIEDQPYFMIQDQFEFPDGGICHFESHKENLTEHCKATIGGDTFIVH